MADARVQDLPKATKVYHGDKFVLEQNGQAMNLEGNILAKWLLELANARGMIKDIAKVGTDGLIDHYRIYLTDGSTFNFDIKNGGSVLPDVTGHGYLEFINNIPADPNTGNFTLTPLSIPDYGSRNGTSGAALANSMVQEYYLGDHFSEEQSEDVRTGRFEKVRVGGYWIINGRKYWAADADYHFEFRLLNTHHMIVVPDKALYNEIMNETDTTEGGYCNSYMFKSGLNKAKDIIKTDFGGDHILTFDHMLSNANINGEASGFEHKYAETDLLSERMVYGNPSFGKGAYNAGSDNSVLALFAARHDLVGKSDYWLRDICGNGSFVLAGSWGHQGPEFASRPFGVRPYFLVY